LLRRFLRDGLGGEGRVVILGVQRLMGGQGGPVLSIMSGVNRAY
jgi:hypothetical protein